jgi:hypothetical protein
MRWAKVPCGKNDNHDLSNGVVIVFLSFYRKSS